MTTIRFVRGALLYGSRGLFTCNYDRKKKRRRSGFLHACVFAFRVGVRENLDVKKWRARWLFPFGPCKYLDENVSFRLISRTKLSASAAVITFSRDFNGSLYTVFIFE